MSYPKLDRKTKNYCGVICNEVLAKRKGKKKLTKWDYPAMAVSCSEDPNKSGVSDYSRGVVDRSYSSPYAHELKNALMVVLRRKGRPEQLGSRTNCGNRIGRCAEQHAANKLMTTRKKTIPLGDICFSKALRPRTLEIRDYCSNCKNVFPTL